MGLPCFEESFQRATRRVNGKTVKETRPQKKAKHFKPQGQQAVRVTFGGAEAAILLLQ